MATENKNKVVDNYILQDLQHVLPDHTQIWEARHKILKRPFTVKRIKYKGACSDLRQSAKEDQIAKLYQQNAVTLLKRLPNQSNPKCHKIITTTHSIYAIFDIFPALSLSHTFQQQHPKNIAELSPKQIKTLLLGLAKAVGYYHSKSVALVGLNPENILLKQNLTPFSSEWQHAQAIQPRAQVTVSPSSVDEYMAPEVRDQGVASLASDIFSLGTVFFQVLKVSSLLNSKDFAAVRAVVELMTRKQSEKRPSIQEVVSALDKVQQIILGSSGNSRKVEKSRSQNTLRNTTMNAPEKTQISPGDLTRRRVTHANIQKSKTISTTERQIQGLTSTRLSHKIKATNMISRNKSAVNIDIPLLSSTRSVLAPQGAKAEGQQLTKVRNLAFFLLDLSEYVIKLNKFNELAFLLAKEAYLTLQGAAEKWSENQRAREAYPEMTTLLTEELTQIKNVIHLIRKLFSVRRTSSAFQQEVNQLLTGIDEAVFREYLLRFGNEMVMQCEVWISEQSSASALLEALFKTYLVLKRVEEDSYAAFWEKVYQDEWCRLQSQPYFGREKRQGFRYLKGKIAGILSGAS